MDKLPPIPSPPGTRLREFRINVLPAVVFGLVLTLTIRTWRNYVEPAYLVGEVQSIRSTVTIASTARISAIKVQLLDRVIEGEPVAEVITADPRYLEAQAALTRARLEFVRVSIEPKLRKENNLIGYAKLRLDWLHERSELANHRAQLAFWEAEAERLGKLSHQTNGTPFISTSELQRAEAQADSLRGIVAELATLVSETGIALQQLDPGDRKLDEEVPAAVRAAMAMEQRALETIEAQLRPMVLHSTIHGVVSAIHHQSGEAVLPGEAILTISSLKSEKIIAYVRQPLRQEIQAGMKMQVRARSYERSAGIGVVLAVGGQLEQIPSSLQRNGSGVGARTIELGLPILVALPPDLRLLPGELVDLKPELP